MLKRLWFTDTLKGVAQGLFNQAINAVKRSFICFLPIQIIFPGMFREDQFHSLSSRSVPLPLSSSATEASKRRAFFGARSK